MHIVKAVPRELHPVPKVGHIYLTAFIDEDVGAMVGDEVLGLFSFIFAEQRVKLGDAEYVIPYMTGLDETLHLQNMICRPAHIVYDYTAMMEREMSARKIQTQWLLYRKRKAAKVIKTAFLEWKDRKATVWNPNTFIGIVDMMVNFIRLKA